MDKYIIGPDNDFPPVSCHAIIGTNDGLVYWCIYASHGLNNHNAY